MEIRKNPVTLEGKGTTPPVWDMSCLEQVCGICTMVINGRVRQSCSALVDDLLLATSGDTITLEPMSKFPNVRDLKVDRSKNVRSPETSTMPGSNSTVPTILDQGLIFQMSCPGTLRILSLYDVWMLSGGVSAISRRQLHRPAGDRPGSAI